jgi:hypothetical protein
MRRTMGRLGEVRSWPSATPSAHDADLIDSTAESSYELTRNNANLALLLGVCWTTLQKYVMNKCPLKLKKKTIK